ncbi:MAG TPA: tetratricopeptide repeat protein, partial [Isosphaeraceae bacterium]|nr:tetratricopeptide repeat protein [Isosphaeraceae bacterium]
MTRNPCRYGLFLTALLLAWPALPASAQRRAASDVPAADVVTTPEEERERKVMERFLVLLEKAPRRGTALDRVYGYHVERGTLDTFVKGYEDRVAKDPKDGAAWLILGLVESQRGRDAAAVNALRQAEVTRPEDPLPPYYVGLALVLVGQPEAAAEAFERAIERKPPRADLLEIFQALGRVHQRAHRNDQALAVWNRLEQLFPDDLRVQEQIALALAEESQPALALTRYESLAKKTQDDYRKVQFKIESADLKVRLSRTNDALADFESLLGKLNPESWLYREVRRRIEDVFLRNDDQAGLAKYYEQWIQKTPEDVDAMARLGRTLGTQGRLAEAQKWFDQAVKLAPSRKELRLALVEQFVHDKKFAEAAAQYEAMAKTDPTNPDTLREWGRLILKDTTKPDPDRKKAAAAVWRSMVDAKPKDAATAVQVADLSRQAGLTDDAIALYKKAIELDPSSPQYYEYLGEYYHNLKRPEDALATWAEITAGPNKNAKNLGRLAEVQSGFGYRKQALEAIAQACKLDPESFDLQIQYADLLQAAERFDDAMKQLDVAAKAADDPEQLEAVLDRQIKNYQAGNTLTARIDALKTDLDAGNDATAERWRLLARYWEAVPKLPEASQAIKKALELDQTSVPSWAVAARLHETSGNLTAAADAYRRLAEIDRRARTDYLMNVAKLESRRGRRDLAMKAGRDLLAAAPGNVENYQFFADLCFQLGQTDEGLDVLRRAVRLNEADPKALLSLAETLSQQFRTDESIEMFWRAFEKTPELDAKLGIVSRLASLYLQRNQFDRLTSRLERMGREADQQREMAICLAQAYAASGDYGTARQELERLLTANTRDTQLLTQLSSLAESEGDTATAAKYQRQLLEIAPNDEGSARLAQLYVRAGEISEAEVIWARLASGEPESHQVLQAIDSLLAHEKADTVLGITEGLLRKQPANWEALYREARALVELQRPAEAGRRFQALLDVRSKDDDQSVIVKARSRGPAGRPAGVTANQPSAFAQARANPLQARMGQLQTIRMMTGLETRYYGMTSSWSPTDFGSARIASLAWLINLAQKNDTQDEVVKRVRESCARTPTDARPFWDLYYLQIVRQEYAETFEAAKALSLVAATDLPAQWAYLSTLPSRATSGPNAAANNPNSTDTDTTPPLAADELDHVLTTFRDLKRRKPEWVTSPTLSSVATELKRAKRTDLEDQFYRDAIDAASDADSAANVMRLAAERGDVENVIKLFDAYERLRGNRALSGNFAYVFYGGFYAPPSNPTDSLARAMCARADAKSHTDVLRLLDRYMVTLQRPDQVVQRARARSSGGGPNRLQFQIWTGKTPRYINVDFPAPNAYFDLGGIQVLRTAFELYKRDDLLSDLFAHVRKPLASESQADQVYAHLALCYLHWWNEEKDDALKQLTDAASAAKSDPELLLNLAELRAERNEPDEALAVADSFEPLDLKSMQRRELLALRLAVLTGDVDRARRASERLFGLRLDAETQVQLAAQMHQLGMHELAEAILARARRRAGNNANALVGLMLQYQRQNNMDVAVQIAHQILRRIVVKQFSPYSNDNDAAERQAIQVLARSGRLKETIARLEAQVEHSPTAVQLQQVLADYYKAAGEKDKVAAVYDRIAKLKPDDGKLRYQIAMNLLHSGEAAASIDHFKVAIKKDPSLLGYQYWEIQNAFQQVNKFDELVDLVQEIDIKALRQPWEAAQLVQTVLRDKKKREQGLALFRKAWKAYPDQRSYLLTNINDDEIWQLPEMYECVREAAIPAKGRSRVAPWEGVDTVTLWMGQGKVLANGTRMLELATKQGKLEPLAREIEASVKR